MTFFTFAGRARPGPGLRRSGPSLRRSGPGLRRPDARPDDRGCPPPCSRPGLPRLSDLPHLPDRLEEGVKCSLTIPVNDHLLFCLAIINAGI